MSRLISSAFIVALTQAYTQSLSDCNAFAATFANTCTDGFVAGADILTQTENEMSVLTCGGSASWCVGESMTDDEPSPNCTFNSFMCVTCLENNDDVVKIRYQSNNMPNVCWETNTGNPNVADYVAVDFKVDWNPDMTGVENYPASSFATSSDVDAVMCDIGRTADSNMPETTTYEEMNASTGLTTWSGVSRGNIGLYNALAMGNLDAVILEGETMDKCMSHASPNNFAQHAHSISPCMTGSALTGSLTEKPGACNADGADCFGTDFDFMRQGWTTDDGTYGGNYGLAKDGHVIYGPFNADGEIWTCDDVDMCNGFFLADGSYGYASTSFFPYLVGCWGPASAAHDFLPTCTENGCGVSQSAAYSGLSMSALAIAAFTINSVL